MCAASRFAVPATLACAFLIGLPATILASGVEVCTTSDSSIVIQAPLPQPDENLRFYYYRSRSPGSFARRDIEFQWDSLLTAPPTELGLSETGQVTLDILGKILADTLGLNPFGANLSDIRLTYEYFRATRPSYDAINPFAQLPFLCGSAVDLGWHRDEAGDVTELATPTLERGHVDLYLYLARTYGGRFRNVGQWPSVFTTPKEDSSTGRWLSPSDYSVFGTNSIMFPAPSQPAARIDTTGTGWTRPNWGADWTFCHEFQHSLNDSLPADYLDEILSSGAEALAGNADTIGSKNFEVPYTWHLLQASNYQNWRLLSAYLLYNWRGADTSSTLAGFTDDLFYRWANNGKSLVNLREQLSDTNCPECGAKPYFHPGGQPLDNMSRLALLLHHWRVANYVNNPVLADRQYGFPPQFGFSPKKYFRPWQNVSNNPDSYPEAVPPEVVANGNWLTRDTTVVGSRTYAAAAGSRIMKLNSLGSEYWIVRSAGGLTQAPLDLFVRVSPESVYHSPVEFPEGNCFAQDGRLVASLVAYSVPPESLETRILWAHPEWATLALDPVWVDVDSAAGSLQLSVGGFGTTYNAAVVVISLGDGPSQGTATWTTFPNTCCLGNNNALPYRVSFALRAPPSQATSPVLLHRTAGAADDKPAWSPGGQELAFQSTIPSFSSYSQIYRRALDGSPPAPLVLQPHNQYAPDWSPRGDWVAFERDSGSVIQSDIWAYNTTSSELRRLTYWPSLARSPAFSPNGQTIAYARYPYVNGNQSADAWVLRTINLDRTGDAAVVSLGTPDEFRSIRWSHDGSQIYFTRNDSLFAVSASGGEPSYRGDLIAKASSFDLHPAGWRLLAEEPKTFPYRTSVCGAPPVSLLMRRIALRNVPNRDSETRFYRTGAEFFNPRWSPDGTRIAYVSDQNSPGDRDLFVGQVSYNHAPTFSSPPRDTTLALPCGPYTFAFNIGATDPDGEAVTYQAANLPPGATLVGNQFSWTNPGPPGKDYYVAFRAIDGSGGVASKVAKFTLLPDPSRPAAVSDVAVETGRYSAIVTWTAPGDDSLIGTACRYDMRYSTAAINESTFLSIPDTIATGSPGPSGTLECAEFIGLSSCTWYHVAVRTRDDAGKWSGVSNVGSGKTKCSGYLDLFCEGGMFAQGGGGEGWTTENALLGQAPLGELSTDGLQLMAGLEPTDGQYQLRLVETGPGAVALDEVTLATVDHPSATRAFLSGDRAVLGSVSPAFRVIETSGLDVTDAMIGGAIPPYVGLPGSTLLVTLNESGAAGEALLLETAAGGPPAPLDSSGILIQVPGGARDWVTVVRHQPRRRFGRFVADSLGSGTVRLVFQGEHVVRFIGRITKSGTATPQRLTLVAAKHSRLGDATAALAAAGLTATTLAMGDAVTLDFAAPSLAAGQVRDWALFVRGTPVTSKSTLATRAVAPADALPVSFALHQNQPNPFAVSTTFRFDLPRPEIVRLELFDLGGRRVAKLRDAWMPAGRHSLEWNSRDAEGSPVRAGAYVYRIIAGSFRAQRKLVVLP